MRGFKLRKSTATLTFSSDSQYYSECVWIGASGDDCKEPCGAWISFKELQSLIKYLVLTNDSLIEESGKRQGAKKKKK